MEADIITKHEDDMSNRPNLYDQGDRDDFVSDEELKKAGFYASRDRPRLSQTYDRIGLQEVNQQDDEALLEYIKEKVRKATRSNRLVDIVRFPEHRLERRFPPCILIQCASDGENRFYQGEWQRGGHGSHLHVSDSSVIVADSVEQAKHLHLLADRIRVLSQYEDADKARGHLANFVWENFEHVGARLTRLPDKHRDYLLRLDRFPEEVA